MKQAGLGWVLALLMVGSILRADEVRFADGSVLVVDEVQIQGDLVRIRYGPLVFYLSANEVARVDPPAHDDPQALSVCLHAAVSNDPSWDGPDRRRFLEALSDPRSAETACGLLGSQNADVRLDAIRFFGAVPDPRALRGLVEACRGGEPDIRVEAIASLAAYGQPEARETLTDALSDADPAVRAAAIHAVSQDTDVLSTDLLLNMVNRETDIAPRLEAIAALGGRRGGAIVGRLTELLGEADLQARQAARAALKRIDESK